MKYLKIFLAVIAVLAIIFFGNGLITPSINYENQVVVNKPAAEVWSVMSDPSNMSEWLPGFLRMEHVSGNPGEVGAVSNIYFDENGEEMVLQETILENVPNERMAMNFTADFMNMNYEMTLDEANGQTTITSISTTEGNGLFAKSILSFMGGTMHTQEEENLTRLKALIER
ncbi:MAG: SRPBCC family protein [Vicingaceae bacterium]